MGRQMALLTENSSLQVNDSNLLDGLEDQLQNDNLFLNNIDLLSSMRQDEESQYNGVEDNDLHGLDHDLQGLHHNEYEDEGGNFIYGATTSYPDYNEDGGFHDQNDEYYMGDRLITSGRVAASPDKREDGCFFSEEGI